MKHPMNSAVAITGLGLTEMGRVYRDAEDLAAEAVFLALEDAGLQKSDLDGLLINAGISDSVGVPLHMALGIQELKLLTYMQGYGSSAGQMVQYAGLAIANGLASTVCCVFADSPLKDKQRSGAVSYARASEPDAMSSLDMLYGFSGALPKYALAAQRHMDLFGTTQDQLGAVAISQRQWAALNPRASKRELLDLEGYNASPWVVEPFHVLDCCLVSNGGVAVIVTSAERARDLKQPPVYVRGFAQAHKHDAGQTNPDSLIRTAAAQSGARALAMAEASVADINQCQIYDCYTYTVVATLEDYGFCKKGEGGPFVEEGRLGPGGALPTNTGGGELSSFYMWGMTPISEAVIQARGHGGPRQAPNELIMVSGNGGLLAYHATLVMSPNPA